MPYNITQYDRDAAVKYAHKWAYSRNPAYYNYNNIGGDCTNFASQCIYAGAKVMNYNNPLGWYYTDANNKSPSWTGVQFLSNFLVSNEGIGPYAEETLMANAQPGDIVQISFDGETFKHSPVIVAVGAQPSTDNILIAAHTFDSDNRALSTYEYKKLRFLHILGVRK